MAATKRTTGRPRRVSASELAQMAVCERRVLLEHRFGKHISEERRTALRRGQRVHRRFLKGRCTGLGRWRWIRPLIDWIQRLLGGSRSEGGGQ